MKLAALDPTAYRLKRDTDLQGDLFDVQHERKTWRRFGHEVTSIVFASLSWDIEFVAPKEFLLRGCALGLIARLAKPVRPGVGQQGAEGGSFGSGVMRQPDRHDFFLGSGVVAETAL